MENQIANSSQYQQYNNSNISLYSNFLLSYLNKTFITNFLNVIIYPIDLNTISSNNYEYLMKFANLLNSDINNEENIDIPKSHYFSLLKIIKNIIKLKDDEEFNFINYENILSYIPAENRFITSIFENINEIQIKDNIEFNKCYNTLIQDIQIYNQMQVIKSVVYKWNTFLNISNSEESNLTAINWVKNFRDSVVEANNSLAELSISDKDKKTDFMMFYDETSIKESVNSIVTFLKTSYRCYSTGYELFDKNISGLESSSVMIIAGPSNHAKSIFLLNILKSVMQNNDTSEDNDVYIMITLEDDINKLFRRILSIFGNYDSIVVKSMFGQLSELLQSDNNDKELESKISELLQKVTTDSIISITKGKKHFVLKHSSENSFSMEDAQKVMDNFERQGLKVRGLFIDYIDVMIPSKNTSSYSGDDYNAQGEIVKEMRSAARNYGIPILTITQNSRISENFNMDMSNQLIGDSFKKIRYADTIAMIRQRPDIDIFSSQVTADISISNNLDNSQEFLKYLIPFEVKITKAKDGLKNSSKFHIFNSQNLRIYEDFDSVVSDTKICSDKSDKVKAELSLLGLPENVEIDFDENDEFSNLFV